LKSIRSVPIWFAGALLLVSCGATDEAGPESLLAPVEVQQRGSFSELDRDSIRLSPDGSQLAFLAPFEGVTSLWLAPAGDLDAARAVTASTEPVEGLWWSYSGRHILFRHGEGSAQSGRIAALSIATGESTVLTPAERQAQLVHLSPSNPDSVVVAVAGEADGAHDLVAIDIESGEQALLAENEPFAAWGVDDDLDLRLAFESTDDGGLRVRKKAEIGEWADFSWVPTEDAAHTRFLGFDADALQAYFLDSRGRQTAALVASDMTSGEARVLFQDPTADVIDVLVHPVEKTVQAVASAHKQRQWRVLDEAVRADLRTLQELSSGDLEIIDRSLDDTVWLAAIAPFDAPRRFYRYDRGNRGSELLFVGRPGAELAKTSLATVPSAQ